MKFLRDFWARGAEDFGGKTTFHGQLWFHLLHHPTHWVLTTLIGFAVVVGFIIYTEGLTCPRC